MLELRQEQKLQPVLTQQLQQAIKLLQLSQVELVEAIEQEIEENPVLEAEEPAVADESEREAIDKTDDMIELLERYSGSEEYSPREEKEYPDFENIVRKTSNLRDHLRWQAGLSDFMDNERITAEWVIENIDDNGYLAYPLKEISEVAGIPIENLESVLTKIQNLDPPGVGARDLRECILIQYRLEDKPDPVFETVIGDYFDLFQRSNIKELARKTGYSIEDIKEIYIKIKHYDPKPGRNFSDDYASPVVPDVYVVKGKDDFEVFLNNDDIPELRMSKYYIGLYRKKSVSTDTRRYIRQKIKQAEWFIKSIEQRQRTLYRVSESLVNFQRDFLEYGIRHLKPLNLRDVAQELGVHESTVSRVTANKYVSTPQGIYEMKFFFPTGLGRSNGESFSTNVVMDIIAEMIREEDKSNPLTDDEIVSKLNIERSVRIARRTIVKYREILNIPSSRARKIQD